MVGILGSRNPDGIRMQSPPVAEVEQRAVEAVGLGNELLRRGGIDVGSAVAPARGERSVFVEQDSRRYEQPPVEQVGEGAGTGRGFGKKHQYQAEGGFATGAQGWAVAGK
jgi:hypothetical protein